MFDNRGSTVVIMCGLLFCGTCFLAGGRNMVYV